MNSPLEDSSVNPQAYTALYCACPWNGRGLKPKAICGLEFEVLFQNWGLRPECHTVKPKSNQLQQPISNCCACKTKIKVVVL